MSKFYCREDELRKLNKRYAGDKFECIVIYGRRRVGKTALINEFCKDKPTIFFSALNTTGKENLEALSKSIMSFERPDMESVPEFRSYDAALDELTALSKEKRIVFVMQVCHYRSPSFLLDFCKVYQDNMKNKIPDQKFPNQHHAYTDKDVFANRFQTFLNKHPRLLTYRETVMPCSFFLLQGL